MRISLLEKREDFYNILETTLLDNEYATIQNESFTTLLVNVYLNFIASSNLPVKTFKILINEYSTSLFWWKNFVQANYVKLAVSKIFRSLLAQRKILLPEFYTDKLILGGNHRLRLFTKELDKSIVILKNGERKVFIENDIYIRSSFNLSYAPTLINTGNNWFVEEYFEGIPINRLNNSSTTDNLLNTLIKTHFDKLISITKSSVYKEEYVRFVKSEINEIINNNKIKSSETIQTKINRTFELIISKLDKSEIAISWTHGDFQLANIIVKDNYFRVIDWEASSKRFYLYDYFVLLSDIRSGKTLNSSILKFISEISKYDIADCFSEKDIYLLIIEELRFSVNEDFSENFYFCGINTHKLCLQIDKYLN